MSIIASGLQQPTTVLPPRQPSSLRRTSHVDIHPDVTAGFGTVMLQGRARDLLSAADGTATVLDDATVHAEVGAERRLVRLDTSPAAPATSALLGLPVAGGFRQAVEQAVPDLHAAQTPLFLLLDDLPVATLISGYAMLYQAEPPAGRAGGMLKSDICSGWRGDGTMMTALHEDGRIPIPLGPVAPVLEPDDDAWAWHGFAALPVGAMRRRRLIDVIDGEPSGPLEIVAMFRDTHVGDDGVETVLHEYSLTMSVDRDDLRVREATATPQVLPWIECPAAAASANRLAGHPVAELRTLIRQDFRGITTCTHLNDLLRSLADVAPMAGTLRAELRARR